MNGDSLDWIWEDLRSPDVNDGSGDDPPLSDDDADDDRPMYGGDGDDRSEVGSGMSFGDSLLVGDPNALRQLNAVVEDVKRQYYYAGAPVDDDDDDRIESCETERDDEARDCDGTDASDDALYVDALRAVQSKLSGVRLAWTDTLYNCTVNGKTVPDSYTKTTNIEKLLLLYASNFIEQFKVKYPDRRQLSLVHANEFGVQKCICTTIKPSRLVYHDLNDMTTYSDFVAKHITYIKLEDPLNVPKKISSPTTVLEFQTAHCFELATLLVSFLIGCGYNAFVVQGYASESVCENDMTKIKLDHPKDPMAEEQSVSENGGDMVVDEYYSVEPMIDLCSEYVTFLMEEERKKNVVHEEMKEDSYDTVDPLYGKRVHCWAMIVPPEIEDENYPIENSYFVEPSTGERRELSDENFIGIEALWNHKNYWVNLQSLDGGCTQYNFALMNTKCWEHFLMDEPQSLRGVTLDAKQNEISRHLVMPNSWVKVLEVPRNKYLMLYPSGKKIVPYMNALKEYYADYVLPDGLIEKTTFYAEPDYSKETFVKEIFKHRVDKLIGVDIKYVNKNVETTEYFLSGRKDCLKVHKFCGDSGNIETKRTITYYNLRLDSMIELKIDAKSFVALFKERSDLLFWRMCVFQKTEKADSKILNIKRKPMNIIEKFLRDESKHKDRDIATRNFNFASNNIYVQYQFGEGQITQSSRLFSKPTVTSSDEFDSQSVIENIVYPYEGHLKPHEAYTVLQEMIEAEKEALQDVSSLEDDVIQMLELRSREQSEFNLKLDTLDWDRNHKIRKLIQKEKDKKFAISEREKAKQLEYALPYYEMVKRPFTREVAMKLRDKIIKDFRKNTLNHFVRAKKLFLKKQKHLEFMIKALEIDNFKEHDLKNKTIVLCSSLKNELDVLTLKMERYKETRVQKYNNLASYLNSNPDFKQLSRLKIIT